MLKHGFDVTEDFFRDLQEEYRNWEASAASQGKPKSLWEELAVRFYSFVTLSYHFVWNQVIMCKSFGLLLQPTKERIGG